MKKSYFRKVLSNFMVTLCVPIITILLLYIHAESSVKKQTMMYAESTLNQFYAAVDTIVEEMGQLCLAMVVDEECERYISYSNYYPKKAAYQATVVSNALDIFWEERYLDVFVYYPYQDRVISAQNASGSAWHYYNSYYGNTTVWGKEAESWGDFQKIINCESASPVFSAIQKNDKTYLCAAASQWKFQGEKFDYTVVVVLNADFMENLMGIDELDADISMMMFDREKELLFAGSQGWSDFSLDGYDPGLKTYDTQFEEYEYKLFVKESANLNGYYAIAAPVAFFGKAVNNLRVTTGIGIIFSIISSILIALQGGLRSWRPVENTFKKLTGGGEHHDINASNELEYIELIFQRESEKSKMLQGKMKKGEMLQREKDIISLLDGSAIIDDGSVLEGRYSFAYDGFIVCSVEVEKNTQDMGMLSFVMHNVWEELCSQVGAGYMVNIFENGNVLLINCAVPQRETVMNLIAEGKAFIEKHYQVKLTIGISEMHTGIDEVSIAYEEAENAIAYRYLAGAGSMIEYIDIKNREFRYSTFEEQNLSALLLEYVHDKNQMISSRNFVEEIFETYEIQQDISLDTMECFRFEVLNGVHKVMTGGHYQQEQKKEKLERLLLAADMKEFKEYLIVLMEELYQENKERNQQKDICLQAKSFIEDNYEDAQLSLDTLGEEIGCSSAYLSRKFKEKYGISVLNYITDTRISRAKILLIESEYSVQEISQKTGFLSSSTFVKTFKKKEGVAPGAYRNMFRGQE